MFCLKCCLSFKHYICLCILCILSHGYSVNSIIIWNFNKMKRIKQLIGHKCRVLYLASNPNNTCIVSGAAGHDKTLKYILVNQHQFSLMVLILMFVVHYNRFYFHKYNIDYLNSIF